MILAAEQARCWKCGNNLDPNQFGRQESCPQCGMDTKVCKNCGFYDTAYNNHCRESQADRVVEKEKANFCDYFIPSGRGGTPGKSAQDLKAAAEALFKKK